MYLILHHKKSSRHLFQETVAALKWVDFILPIHLFIHACIAPAQYVVVRSTIEVL